MHSRLYMENRNSIVNEFFQLRVLLNRANKKPNQRTELTFKIRSLPNKQFQFGTHLEGEGAFLELCIRDKKTTWERSGSSKFRLLEDFCARQLNECEKNLQITSLRNLTEVDALNICGFVLDRLRNLL